MLNKETQRALAYIVSIDEIQPIPNYDRVEHVRTRGWWVVCKKDDFKIGDKAIYFEVDSKVPSTDERFSFLEKKHYKIKTQKMCKVYSQGLLMPINLFPELENKDMGSDVTEDLKITYSSEEDIKRKSNKVDPDAKYKAMANRKPNIFKKPIVRKIMKHRLGRKFMFLLFGRKKDNPKEFPKWIVKTDETRIENAPFYLQSEDKWIKTEKCDGTSCTYAVDRLKKGKNKFDFIVCSRNVRQADREQACYHDSNIYWELADKYDIEKVLTNFAEANGYNRVVLQGEGVGSVQGNPYKLKENELYVFNLIIDGVRLGTVEMAEFCHQNGLKHVPIIDTEYTLPNTMEEMKLEADGFSELNPKVKREGFVYRSIDGQQSFKNVSREYLLKHNG